MQTFLGYDRLGGIMARIALLSPQAYFKLPRCLKPVVSLGSQ